MRNQIIALLAVAMLLIGFGATYLAKPTSTDTETSTTITRTFVTTFTSTMTRTQAEYLIECNTTIYQVEQEYYTNSVTGYPTSITIDQRTSNYTTATTIQERPGYTTSISADVVGTGTTATGPMIKVWNSTVCTWLPG